MVTLDVKVGDTLEIGNVRIYVKEKSGRSARLCVDAPKDVKIQLAEKPKPLRRLVPTE